MLSNDKDYLPDEMIQRGFEKKDGTLYFNANFFADFIRKKYKMICTEPEKFYVYKKGVYIFYDISAIKKKLYYELQEPYFGTWTKHKEEEYIKSLERLVYVNKELNSYRDLINLKNGMFDLTTYKLKRHSSKYYSSIQLPIVYDAEAKCPQFKKFLKEVFCGDKELICFAQEMIGYCISTDMEAQCFFILFGTGANGKSLLCNLIKKLVGDGNYSSLALSDLGKSFSRADLQNKILNISAENESENGKPFNSQYVKAISGGDDIKAEFKGKDVFTFKPFCKLIFAVNSLPNFTDKTNGFIRRVKIIPFNATFSIEDGTADIHLEDKLTEELSGIFNWAIRGLRRLRKNGYQFSKCSAVQDMLTEYSELINPYILYWNECIIYNYEDIKVRTRKKDLFDDFTAWASRNNHSNLARITPKRFWFDIALLLEQLGLPALRFQKSGGTRYVLGVEFAKHQTVWRKSSLTIKEMELDVDETALDNL